MNCTNDNSNKNMGKMFKSDVMWSALAFVFACLIFICCPQNVFADENEETAAVQESVQSSVAIDEQSDDQAPAERQNTEVSAFGSNKLESNNEEATASGDNLASSQTESEDVANSNESEAATATSGNENEVAASESGSSNTSGAVTSQAELEEAIANAPDDEEITIVIGAYIEISKTIVIPKGKKIILVNDGEDRNIHPKRDAEPMPMFDVFGTLTIDTADGDDAQFRIYGDDQLRTDDSLRGKATAVDIRSGGTLNLKGGTIIGGTISNSSSGAVVLRGSGSTFNMSGGVIKDTIVTSGGTNKGRDYTSAVVLFSGSTFNMTGGMIEDNKSYPTSTSIQVDGTVYTYPALTGGAIFIDGGTINIYDGAVIRNNYSHIGGAIFIYGGNVNVYGGLFEGNTAGRLGGAITVAYKWAELSISGGKFDSNVSRQDGGAIWTYGKNTKITGGYFVNNRASGQGGAIALAEDNESYLFLQNAIIRNNTAYGLGGGIWLCPVGSIEFVGEEGVAIYDNTAGRAGDDFVSVWPIDYKEKYRRSMFAYLSDTILAGQRVEYYKDGALTPVRGDMFGTVDPSVPRYDADSPGERQHIYGEVNEGIALKAVISDDSRALYDELAKQAEQGGIVLIENNTAYWGGGIGGNSNVVNTEFGQKPEEAEIKVIKKWADNVTDDNIPEEIVMLLLYDGKQIDYVVLNKENEWQVSFGGLNKGDVEAGRYAIDEEVPPNFAARFYDLEKSEDDENLWIMVIENEKIPEAVEGEYEPGDGETAQVMGEYEEEKNDETVVKSANTSYGVPTGDSEELHVWIIIAIAALMTLIAFAAASVRMRHRA